MRIVQLSDLHASALLRAPHMKDLVARVNSLSPDLVVITGDLVDGEVDVQVRGRCSARGTSCTARRHRGRGQSRALP